MHGFPHGTLARAVEVPHKVAREDPKAPALYHEIDSPFHLASDRLVTCVPIVEDPGVEIQRVVPDRSEQSLSHRRTGSQGQG